MLEPQAVWGTIAMISWLTPFHRPHSMAHPTHTICRVKWAWTIHFLVPTRPTAVKTCPHDDNVSSTSSRHYPMNPLRPIWDLTSPHPRPHIGQVLWASHNDLEPWPPPPHTLWYDWVWTQLILLVGLQQKRVTDLSDTMNPILHCINALENLDKAQCAIYETNFTISIQDLAWTLLPYSSLLIPKLFFISIYWSLFFLSNTTSMDSYTVENGQIITVCYVPQSFPSLVHQLQYRCTYCALLALSLQYSSR